MLTIYLIVFVTAMVMCYKEIKKMRKVLEVIDGMADEEIGKDLANITDNLKQINASVREKKEKPIAVPIKPIPVDDAFHYHPKDEPKFKCHMCQDLGWFLKVSGQSMCIAGPYKCHCEAGKTWIYDPAFDYSLGEPFLKNKIKGYPGE